MSRAEIVAGLLSLYRSPRYLEVGVFQGESFLPQKAARKVGVDPDFKFDEVAAAAADRTATFHRVESDHYFGVIARPEDQFDVIFLDGLHTFEQTLRDFMNATAMLAPGGAIVIDDVWPSNAIAALPDLDETLRRGREPGSGWDGAWMGDVYRLVMFIDSFAQGFTFRTVKETGGQLVLWRRTREKVKRRTMADIAAMPFEAIAAERAQYNVTPYGRIRDELARHVKSHSGRASLRSHLIPIRRPQPA